MEITYLVDPLSAHDIELNSANFLREYQPEVLKGYKPLDVAKLLDDIFEDKGFSLQLVSEKELPTSILGMTEMDNKIIKIRETDYMVCETAGYQRMTITHEVGHPRLHFSQFDRNGMRMLRTQSNKIPAFISSEWQARVWASATLMPFPTMIHLLGETQGKTKDDILNAIMEKFIVSRSAADVRYKTIFKYHKDGRFKIIEKSMKELKYL